MTAQHIRFSTLSGFASAEESFAAYHDLYAPVADVVRLGGAFSVDVEARRLGQLIVFDRRLEGVGHVRNPERVMRNAYDHFTVQLCLAGSFRIQTEAGSQDVNPGELALVDMARWMRTDAPRVRLMTMSIPRERIAAAVRDTDRLHGSILPVERASLLKDFTLGILRDGREFGGEDRDRIERVATDLLAIGLSTDASAAPAGHTAGREVAVRIRARRFIDAHLACGPADVARAVGRSRSSLYRDFDAVGGIADYIQSRRLKRFRDLLMASDRYAVTDLAAEAGFAHAESAARAFKARFGVTPRQFRLAKGAPSIAAPPTVLSTWWDAFR